MNTKIETVLSDELCQTVLDLYEMESGRKALNGEIKAVTVGDKEHGNGKIGAFFAALTVQYKDAELGAATDKRSSFSIPVYDLHIANAESNITAYAKTRQSTGDDTKVHYPKCWSQYISDCRRFIGLGVAKEVYAKNNTPIGILKIKSMGLEAKAKIDSQNNPWLSAKMALANAKETVAWFDKAQPGENHTMLTARRDDLISAINGFVASVLSVRAKRVVKDLVTVHKVNLTTVTNIDNVPQNEPPVIDAPVKVRRTRKGQAQAIAA